MDLELEESRGGSEGSVWGDREGILGKGTLKLGFGRMHLSSSGQILHSLIQQTHSAKSSVYLHLSLVAELGEIEPDIFLGVMDGMEGEGGAGIAPNGGT